MNDIFLSLDPGSIRTGWAVMDRSERILEAGVLKPDKLKSEPRFRIAGMCLDLQRLLNEFEPSTVIVEITSGKVGRKRHGGSGAGLGTYGMAVGRLWGEAEAWLRSLPEEQQGKTEIVLVKENRWTNGVPKVDRIAAIAAIYQEYRPGEDPGGDVGDAIALGRWYLRERKLQSVSCKK